MMTVTIRSESTTRAARGQIRTVPLGMGSAIADEPQEALRLAPGERALGDSQLGQLAPALPRTVNLGDEGPPRPVCADALVQRLDERTRSPQDNPEHALRPDRLAIPMGGGHSPARDPAPRTPARRQTSGASRDPPDLFTDQHGSSFRSLVAQPLAPDWPHLDPVPRNLSRDRFLPIAR